MGLVKSAIIEMTDNGRIPITPALADEIERRVVHDVRNFTFPLVLEGSFAEETLEAIRKVIGYIRGRERV